MHFSFLFLFFFSNSFCSTCKNFICFYPTTPNPSSPGFMTWEWSGPNFFLVVSFFFLFLLFIYFHCQQKKQELAIISLMMFVFGCVQKLASKTASFLRLNFLVLAHDCDQVERKCDQKNGTRARPEKFCDQHREDFSRPEQCCFRLLVSILSVSQSVCLFVCLYRD